MPLKFFPTPRASTVRRRSFLGAAALGLALICVRPTAPVHAQSESARVSITPRIAGPSVTSGSRAGVIRTDVNRVLVPTTVTDSYGRPVQGLRKQDFRLLEDGVPQELSHFTIDDGPISIGLVLDLSASVKNKLTAARRAVSEFLGYSARGDEFFLLTFKDQPELVRGFTTSAEEIERELAVVQPSGWTALYDAIIVGINNMKRARHDRRVLLVLSDGGDNNSRYSESEVKNLVRESDVRIFSISVQSSTPALDKLVSESGGNSYRVHKLEDLPELAAKVSEEAHSEYILGFTPAERPRDGKYHPVKVEVVQAVGEPRLHVSWRRGYYSPLE
jgi:Ca-activated chloride channel homolog